MRLYIGSKMIRLCKIHHFTSETSRKTIHNLIGKPTISGSSTATKNQQCVISTCKAPCNTYFQAAGLNTEANKRLNFCTYGHLIEYFTLLNAKTWRSYIRNSQKVSKSPFIEDEINDFDENNQI
ncbi:MAG: hypothetical protein ACK4R7_05220 [Fervidobacterium sp.]